MTVVRETIVIEATPAEVWATVSDPRNLPRWNSHIKAVYGVPDDGLVRGSRYSTELRVLGVPFRVGARVLEIDPPRSSVIALFGPLDAIVRTSVRPVGKRRAMLEQDVEYRIRGGPLGALIERAVRKLGAATLLRRGIRAQKRQVEQG